MSESAALERGRFYTAGWVFPKRRRTGGFRCCISQFLVLHHPVLMEISTPNAHCASVNFAWVWFGFSAAILSVCDKAAAQCRFLLLVRCGGIELRYHYLVSALHRWLQHN